MPAFGQPHDLISALIDKNVMGGDSSVVGCPTSALWAAGLSLARAGLETEVEVLVLAVRLVLGFLDTPPKVGDSDNNS